MLDVVPGGSVGWSGIILLPGVETSTCYTIYAKKMSYCSLWIHIIISYLQTMFSGNAISHNNWKVFSLKDPQPNCEPQQNLSYFVVWCENCRWKRTFQSLYQEDNALLYWSHMPVTASQINGNIAVCSTDYSGKKRYISGSLWPDDSPHKGPVIREDIPCHGVIMYRNIDNRAPSRSFRRRSFQIWNFPL